MPVPRTREDVASDEDPTGETIAAMTNYNIN